jgi:hypothetical protein
MSPRYTAAMLKEWVANDKYKPTVLYDYLNVNTGFESNPIGCEIYRSDNGGINWKKVNEKEVPTFSVTDIISLKFLCHHTMKTKHTFLA